MSEVITERVTRTPGVCGGKACLAGHRVRVMDVVIWHEHMGMSADEIVEQIQTITLSDVHAALAYYFDHIKEIREDMRREEHFVTEFMKSNPSALEIKLKRHRRQDAGR